MELPQEIAGLNARLMRKMFKNFIVEETEIDWNGGAPSVHIRRMTSDFIAEQLAIEIGDAQHIQAALVAEEWIEPEKFTPTRKAMALAQHQDRPNLPRAAADALLIEVLDWAERTNAVTDARVKVKSIYLFGSLLHGVDEVGDVDLFVEFTTMDLGMDLQCEDMEREDELSEELTSISDYISPSTELDRKMMDDVPMAQVFPRGG